MLPLLFNSKKYKILKIIHVYPTILKLYLMKFDLKNYRFIINDKFCSNFASGGIKITSL